MPSSTKPTIIHSDRDIHFMAIAVSLARGAGVVSEVPIGAIVVSGDEIISSGINRREKSFDSTSHAEIEAIRAASQRLGNWRLTGCTLYVTLEPCLMCAGAIYLSRIDRVVYGASDPKGGAYESLYEIQNDRRLNHLPAVTGGLLATPSRKLLQDFFASRRSATLLP